MDACSNPFTRYRDDRPILPSLHSLNLPMPKSSDGRVEVGFIGTLSPNDFNAYTYVIPNDEPILPKLHVPSLVSVPSSSPSTHNPHIQPPTPAGTFSSSTSTGSNKRGFCIVPCEREKADAVLLVIKPDVGEKTTLLLLGPVAEPFLKLSSGFVAEKMDIFLVKIAPSKNPSHHHSSVLSWHIL